MTRHAYQPYEEISPILGQQVSDVVTVPFIARQVSKEKLDLLRGARTLHEVLGHLDSEALYLFSFRSNFLSLSVSLGRI